MKRISKTEIKEMRSQSKKNRIMFAFTLPTVILYTIFFLVTMLIGVYYSFTDWNGISKDYTFVGLKNYVKVLTDERFREALWFNIGYTIALVVLLIVIPLTIALALNRIRRLSTLFRSIYFIPAVISMVTVGLIWNELFYRAVPAIGEMLNIEALSTSPLGNPKLAVIAIMVVNIWQGCAIPTVLFIAGLCNIPGLIIMCVTLASSQGVFLLVNYIRSVPRDLEEAAYIDGCGTVKAYVKIVLPMIKPILATIFVLNALWVWNDFQMPLLILNQSQDMWTLPLFQYNFKSQYSFDYNLAFASYLIAMIPVLIAYACAQKHIVSGLTQGAVKS